MLRDVFYYGKKPNVHPREKFASSFEDAKSQATTEHFWIINEFCDYTNFDWDFDFDFLPDEDVWAYEHINIWPSTHQKDSGTWLCYENCTEIKIYRADVTPIKRKNEINEHWVLLDNIDKTKFDFSWHPDPTDPPYIYKWGCKFFPVELHPCLEYHVDGATEIKYMNSIIELAPNYDYIIEHKKIDKNKFDISWRPDPLDPPFIYVWGNKWVPGEVEPTLEYRVPGATEVKHMADLLELLPDLTNWTFDRNIDKTKFDFSWVPDPTSPPYIYQFGTQHQKTGGPRYIVEGATEIKYVDTIKAIALPDTSNWVVNDTIKDFDFSWHPDDTEPDYIYAWGNKWVGAEIASTVEYIVPGATQKKFMSDLVELLPSNNWLEVQQIDKTKFDLTWRPDPTSPPYIYIWGNKWIPGELKSTIEYHVTNATEKKYMTDDVEVLPELDRWVETEQIDRTKFDLTWRPDPREPDYIYVWGNKWVSAEVAPTVEYIVPGATQKKFMSDLVELLPSNNWVEVQQIDKSKFDLTWRPDPTSPPYIYVWGNKWISGELKSTIEYHCPNATEKKYMSNDVEVLPELDRWVENQQIDRTKFDLTWRPDPREPNYIYIWGNKWVNCELKSTLEYHCPGATEYKYIQDPIEVLPETERWNIVQEVSDFDLTWRPDPREPAFIYVWGNKHIAGELKPTVEYHCPNATERKYMGDANVKPEWDRWNILIPVDKTSFDFTWRPDPREPAFIYVWGNQSNSAEVEPTLEYHCEGATERKYMHDVVATTLPIIENWKILIPVDEFDFSWRPDPHSPPYIYVFGNQWHDAMTEPTLEYHVENATDKKYITDVVAKVTPTQEHWKTLIPVENFDYSWRPNPHSTPYIYVFGNQWHDSKKEPTIEYHQPGATDKKYVEDIIAIVKSTATDSNWKRLIDIESFDYSWRPDPHSPPYIYVFGNKWNDGATEPSIEYHVEGATEYKYINYPVAIPKAELKYWHVNNVDDLETFDFTWRPNPHSPPQIYQWTDNGPRYTVPDATEVVLMERSDDNKRKVINRYPIKTTLEDLISEHPEEVFWAINPDLNYDKFDFSWRPNEENFRHVNVFGNEYSKNTQTYYINGPLYMMGHREFNYVEDQSIQVDSSKLDVFFIDRSNTESQNRFDKLKERFPQIQKTRYLNSWVDTINRCVNKSSSKFFWVLSSELDYTDFVFDFYPSPWQEKMVHVFGTQWSHWGNTYFINSESFPEDTKYVKIIEHLSVLNFVKSKKAKAADVLYDVIYIDHGNNTDIDLSGKTVIKYQGNYLDTFKKLLETIPKKRDHYIWVVSTVCDYSTFDFTYICDPFSKEQLHVFPSDKQKFGDTFFVNVNRLRELIEDMEVLEDYNKVNFNQHQRVKRLPAPVFVTSDDTHVNSIKQDFDFPYAIFVTDDNKDVKVTDVEPMNLWQSDTKNITITSTGGSRIVVPKEAKEFVKTELYDYPYIKSYDILKKSKPLDIVFLSNGESCADEHYEHLLKVTNGRQNRIVRVEGVNGRVQAYHAAATASNTPWMFTVFAKLKVDNQFDWDWQPDRLQIPKHYIFHATNPVNGLVYGHQAMIAYNKKITLANAGRGLDFTLDDAHEVVEMNSGIARFNTDPYSTWRTAFRECIKLRADTSEESKQRLNVWMTTAEGEYAEYSLKGAKDAVSYYEEVNGDLDKLRLSYEWAWLQDRFKSM